MIDGGVSLVMVARLSLDITDLNIGSGNGLVLSGRLVPPHDEYYFGNYFPIRFPKYFVNSRRNH